MREAALAARGDEVMSLHEATRAAHAQNNQYVMDLQVGGGGREKRGVSSPWRLLHVGWPHQVWLTPLLQAHVWRTLP